MEDAELTLLGNLTLHFNNQKAIMEALTFLILRGEGKSPEAAMKELQKLQDQWIATVQAVTQMQNIKPPEPPSDNQGVTKQ